MGLKLVSWKGAQPHQTHWRHSDLGALESSVCGLRNSTENCSTQVDPEILPNIESHIWLKIIKKDLDPKLNIFPHHPTMSLAPDKTSSNSLKKATSLKIPVALVEKRWSRDRWPRGEFLCDFFAKQHIKSVLDSPTTGDLRWGYSEWFTFFDLPNGNCWFYEKNVWVMYTVYQHWYEIDWNMLFEQLWITFVWLRETWSIEAEHLL